jgi:hypothetical protein
MKNSECWISTISGRQFHYFDTQPDQIDIGDIAHALSMACRFSGHIKHFYSVAEHSVACSRLVPKEDALAALLHDASEAYIADIAKPIKEYMGDYKKIEDSIMGSISKKFEFQYPLNDAIKYADMVMLSTEAHYLLPTKGDDWSMWNYIKRPPIELGILPKCWNPRNAYYGFLDRYNELTNA